MVNGNIVFPSDLAGDGDDSKDRPRTMQRLADLYTAALLELAKQLKVAPPPELLNGG